MNNDPGAKKPSEAPEPPDTPQSRLDNIMNEPFFKGPRWLRIAKAVGTGVLLVGFGLGIAFGVDRPKPTVEGTVHSTDGHDVHTKTYTGEDVTLEPDTAITVMCDDGQKGYEAYVKGGDHAGAFAYLAASEIAVPPLHYKFSDETQNPLIILEDC